MPPPRPSGSSAPEPIAPGTYRLEFHYSGKINTQATGLFALDYPDKRTGETVRGLFTQFEAPDARRFAPMFDEPSYKATFDLSAIVPANQMAVGNMPIAREEALPDGRKRVTFATTPTMSSYLLFFAVGDFERLVDQGPRRGRRRHRQPGGQRRAGAPRARIDPASSSNTTPTTSACPIRCPSSTTWPPPASRSSSARWRTGARS